MKGKKLFIVVSIDGKAIIKKTYKADIAFPLAILKGYRVEIVEVVK
jgi:hypothetical protein